MSIPSSNIIKFAPPKYMCKRATKPFNLDGNINKPFWEDAPYTDYFIDIEGEHKETPRFKTRAKMLWDDENMYFSAILEGDEIWATLTKRDSVIFHDNDFEIFIDPNSDTHEYYEFEMNALNTVWDLLLTLPYRDGGKPVDAFDIQGLKTAVHIEGELNNANANNKYWSVEVVIPFSVLRQCQDEYRRNPKVSEYYRVNFSRVHWRVDKEDGVYKKTINKETNAPYPEDNWVWAPTGIINIHYPELWGFVFFAEGDEEYDIPDDEYIKWELRMLYYAQHQYRAKNGKYASSFDDIKGDIDFSIEPIIETTGNSFEMRAISRDGEREVCIFANGKAFVKGRS